MRSNTLPAGGLHRQQQQRSGSLHRHWGSSLSLNYDDGPSRDELRMRSRTLRPPTPSDRATPAKDEVWATTLPKKWLPTTHRQGRREPRLRDYLDKPRLVSTLGCVEPRPPRASSLSRSGSSSPYNTQQRSPTPNQQPRINNLRLGSFLDDPNYGRDGEVIPELLRKYYLDTFLDTYESDYLLNYGDNNLEIEDSNPGSGAGSSNNYATFHRGM